MKKFNLLLYSLFMLLLIASCGNREGTTIKGEISNLDNPYILSTYLSSDTIVIDTISVNEKGKFYYNINIDTLTTFTLYMNNFESAAVIFADNGQNIKVNGDALFPDLIRINGNELNDDITEFKKLNEDLLKQRGQLLLNLHIDSNSDTLGRNSIARSEEMANLNLLNHELTLQAEEFIIEHPTKHSSLILISNFFMNSDNPKALERVLGYLKGDVTETATAARLYSYSDKVNKTAEGASMPYFSLIDKDGETITSRQFSGKHLLLSFISTSGIDSRETTELLKNEYAKLNSDSVDFVTIYIDSELYPIDYIENDSIPWIVVPEKRGWGADIVDIFNVQYIPYNILISPEGTIEVRNIPVQGITEIITKIS